MATSAEQATIGDDGIIVNKPELRSRLRHGVESEMFDGDGDLYEVVSESFKHVVSLPASRFRQVANVFIYQDVVFTHDETGLTPFEGTWRLIDQPSRGGPGFLQKAKSLFEECRDDLAIDSGFFLGSAGSANYGHWLIDDLPRLCLARDLIGDKPVILTSHGEAIDRVRRQSVQALRPDLAAIFIDREQFCRVSMASFCDPVSMHPVLKSHAALDRLKEQLAIHLLDGAPRRKRRIFVDRSDRSYRTILNRADLTAFCARHGLDFVYPEQSSFLEQVRLFADAELVVGVMGAAMTNVMFCDASATILFLSPANWKEPFYFDLCDTLGVTCKTYYGTVPEADTAADHCQNFTVDFDRLEHMMPASPSEHRATLTLVSSDRVVGDRFVERRPPSIAIQRNATFVPLAGAPDGDRTWGLYDASGVLIEDAAYKRGPGRMLVGQSDRRSSDLVTTRTIEQPVIYGGMAHSHFGHFLLCVLPRFWSNIQASFPDAKILVHSTPRLREWLATPFVHTLLSAANVEIEDIVTLHEPCLLSCVIVPGPALVEQSRVHQVLDEFGTKVGQRMFARAIKPSDQPLYISREKHASGVWRCTNESALVGSLRSEHVRIFHPEDHSLEEQLAVLEEHRNILALQGDALYSTMFCSAPRRIVAIGPAPEIVSNFHLIDAVKGSAARYVYPTGGMLEGEASPFFQINRAIADPAACAKAMLSML